MYIEVLKTWWGADGTMFVGGETREIDEAVLEKIGDEKLGDKRLLYKIVPAPWDAQKDEKAVRVGELQAAIAKAAVELERLEDELLNMQYRAGPGIGCAVGVLENAEHDHEHAEQDRMQLAAQAGKAAANADKKPTEANVSEAADLANQWADAVRAEKEKSCLATKAQGELLVLNGDIGLTELEVADARAELDAMRAELYELRPDLKPKEDDNGPSKKPEGSEAPDGSPDGKDAADAEGQTDAAGQTAAIQN